LPSLNYTLQFSRYGSGSIRGDYADHQNLDYSHLETKTRSFLEFLLTTLFASVKVKGNSYQAVAEIFEKAAEDPRDMIGLQVIISQIPSGVLLETYKSEKQAKIVELAATASQILQRLAVRIGV
jgi:hypothetical protein